MDIGKDVLSVINALPDAVIFVSLDEGTFLGANDAFFRQFGIDESAVGTDILDLLKFDDWIKNGLSHLFADAVRYDSSTEEFDFIYVNKRMVKNITSTAKRCSIDGKEVVFFNLKEIPSRKIVITGYETASWNAYLSLGCEPYMEFRPESALPPMSPVSHNEDRTLYLRDMGRLLRVKYANAAAVTMYRGGSGSLEGEMFNPFFKSEDDALRFLDMLSIVGQMKAETTVVDCEGNTVNVEMHCEVNFDDNGDIDALYCSQRSMDRAKHYEAIIGGSNLEANFMFNQPFTGYAFLAPPAPIERPQAEENLDEAIDGILNQMLVVRANQAMLDIYGTDKTKFLLKPMTALFSDMGIARQVLKELLVMRTTSVKQYAPSQPSGPDVLENVSVYYGRFDDADRMTGVMLATSKYHADYKARHNYK